MAVDSKSEYSGEDGSAHKNRKGPAVSESAETVKQTSGQQAPAKGSGGVTGSGAGAGGGGGPEEYDSDPMGGGGSFAFKKERPAPDKGGDGSSHGSR